MSFAAIRMTAGRVVLMCGVLILLFIPYLLWGTGLQTTQSQTALRNQFRTDQHLAGSGSTPVKKTPVAGPTKPTVAPHRPDPAVGTAVGVITIPKIGLSMMVVEGTGTDQLEAGPGHYPGTPLPGEAGNAAIAGHRTTYLHPFYNLNELVPGNPITIETLQGIFLYHVLNIEAVSPTDVAVVDPTRTPELTLTTCNPRYSASQRLVVHAALVASILVGHKKPTASTPPSGPVPDQKPVAPTSPGGSWTAAILLGAAVAALTTGLWLGLGRVHRGKRVLLAVSGALVWLVVVFYFFEVLAPLLPASY